MTKQNNALRLAELLTADEWPGHVTLVSYARECVAELRRQHAELETLRAGYDAARLEIESLRGRGWVNLPGQLPEPGKPVLLDIGKKHPIRAMWAAKHTVEAHYEADDDWGEYDEATDMLYSPEGWYEWNEHEEVHWAVTETPRAWRELPAVPGPADGESNELC